MSFLEDTLADRRPRFARLHAHELCRDLECLRTELARVEALGGEGLMLRHRADWEVVDERGVLWGGPADTPSEALREMTENLERAEGRR